MSYFGKKLHVKNKHLYWENDELFFFLADTVWYGLTRRCSEHEFEEILIDRKKKGFTAVQIVIGTPPETSIFDENAKSTHGHFIFDEMFQINEKYFDGIETKIQIIIRHELVPVIYGSWGHYMDIVGEQSMKDMWTMIVDRFSKYPVIFSLCGEVDLTLPANTNSFLKKALYKLPVIRKIAHKVYKTATKGHIRDRIQKWQRVATHLSSINTKKHPITAHIQSLRLATEIFEDNKWIDIDSFQSGHSIQGIDHMNSFFEKLKTQQRAYINLEPLYEGILDQFDVRFQNYAFWKSIFSGAAGHSYGAHGLWQLAFGDNYMSHWGKSDWKEALSFAGSTSIGNAKKFLTQNHIKWETSSEVENIMVKYSSKPRIPHIMGQIDKTIYIYLPYPENVSDMLSSLSFTDCHLIDPNTFEKIISVDFNDLKKKVLEHNELFLALDIV